MMFDWVGALTAVLILTIPIVLILGFWFFVYDKPIPTVLCVLLFFVCVGLLGGIPEVG